MNIKDVEQKVKEIELMSGDDEMAHSNEDDLWESVLLAIANGERNAKNLAKTALKTKDISFQRWCA